MSPLSPSSKRPGILAWVLFSAGVLVSLYLIKSISSRLISGKPSRVMTIGSQANDSFQPQTNFPSFMGDQKAELGYAPSPMPPIDRGGSANMDLDGKKPVQRVIKTGQLSLRVTDAPATVDSIRALATSKNGFVESSSLSDSGSGPRSARMTLRVPVADFDSIISDLKKLATLVLSDSVNGQDVTMEFVDLEADLRNAKAEEQSYLEILKRSGSIEDILAVTQRLTEVRGRIERIEGRKRLMENQTDLATINVSLTEDTRVAVPTRSWRPFEVLKDALRDLVENLQALVNFLIRLVIGVVGLLLPIALIATLIIWIGWRIVLAIIRRVRK